jgi:hypothetical protein
MHDLKPPPFYPMPDRALADADSDKLPPRYDAMLALG